MQITQLAALAVSALAVAQPVVSTIVVTQPVASTKVDGGKRLQIEWNDDGQAPKVDATNWGRINIFLATGSKTTQFKLVQLGQNVAPSKTDFTAIIPPNAGPNGKTYFLRFEGTVLDNKGIPPMAFSARFELDNMRGTFNQTIQQVNQDATDPITGTGATSVVSAPNSLATSRSSVSAPTSATTSSAAPSATNSKSAAAPALAKGSVAASANSFVAGALTLAIGAVAALF